MRKIILSLMGSIAILLAHPAGATAERGRIIMPVRPPLPRPEPLVIRHDSGGGVVSYARRVSRIRRSGRRTEIAGACQSACTLFLSLPPSQICLHPSARFAFHRAYGAAPRLNAWATRYMLTRYPAWVREWIRSRGGLRDHLIVMDYRYASRFLPTCGENRVIGRLDRPASPRLK